MYITSTCRIKNVKSIKWHDSRSQRKENKTPLFPSIKSFFPYITLGWFSIKAIVFIFQLFSPISLSVPFIILFSLSFVSTLTLSPPKINGLWFKYFQISSSSNAFNVSNSVTCRVEYTLQIFISASNFCLYIIS